MLIIISLVIVLSLFIIIAQLSYINSIASDYQDLW